MTLSRIKISVSAWTEKIIWMGLTLANFLVVLITLAILFTLFFETIRFFNQISFWDFITSTKWHPQTTYDLTPDVTSGHQDMPSSSASSSHSLSAYGTYGILPLFTGTVLIMGISLTLAVPVGLFVAIYLGEYAKPQTRHILKPLIELLAGIPTIVYGFFALVVMAPFLQNIGEWLGTEISPQSALGVGVVMGLMLIPYISSLSDDAFKAVPQALRDHSLALGATRSETIKKVVIPAAFPGILSAILLAISRAIGETMLVVMAAGLTPSLTLNPLQSVTTVTVQIVSLLTGDQEFTSPKTLSAFALGMTLFLMTLVLNIISLRVMRQYRSKHVI